MGNTADALIDGEFDYITGEYIGRGVGYPRTLHDRNDVNGVVKWLQKQGVTDKQKQVELMRAYVPGATPHSSKSGMCAVIQQDFTKFRNWFIKLEKK